MREPGADSVPGGRRRTACWALILLLAGGPPDASAGPAVRVREDEAAWMLAAVAIASIGEVVSTRTHGRDGAALCPEGVFGPDRFAIRLNSPMGGTITRVGLTASALALPAACSSGRTAGADACVWVESQLLAAGVTRLIKAAVRRPRPWAYRWRPEDGPLPDDAHRSFVSSHAAAAFSGAALAGLWITDRRADRRTVRLVRVGGLSFAGLAAIGRVLSGKHFPTDVLAGAAVGAAAGWLTATMHGGDS